MKLPTCLATALGSVVLFISMTAPTYVQSEEVAITLGTMHEQKWFWTVMAASVVGWLLGMTKGFTTSGDWLEKYLPSKPLVVVWLLDLFVFVVVGAYMGTGIYNPTTFVSAVGAGLSWPVGLGAMVTKVRPSR